MKSPGPKGFIAATLHLHEAQISLSCTEMLLLCTCTGTYLQQSREAFAISICIKGDVGLFGYENTIKQSSAYGGALTRVVDVRLLVLSW